MRKLIFLILVAAIMLAMVVTVSADTVILKSGEMFQTRKAWRQDGRVYFYRNGKVVDYPESDVERLLEQAPPPTDSVPGPHHPPPASNRPLPALPPSAPPVPMGGDTGYLGLKWEQPASQIKGISPAGTDAAYGGVALYAINKKKKRFGRASVDNIFLGFWQGGLYTILVEVSNYLDFTELKIEAFRRFGEGENNGGDQERYRWSSPVTDRLLSYDDKTGTGYLWMRSHVLHEKVRDHYAE
jgi:hypothetical protein